MWLFRRLTKFVSIKVWLICSSPALFSQSNAWRFKQFSSDDGLSQNSINIIQQDSLGFIWIGTQDGVNRFDGYNFKSIPQPKLLCNNFIWDIKEDLGGVLWIATFGGGLIKYNINTNKSICFSMIESTLKLSSNRIFSIEKEGKSTLWLGTNEGIIQFNKKTNKYKDYLNKYNEAGVRVNNFIAKVKPIENNIWFCGDNGFGLLSKDGDSNYQTHLIIEKRVSDFYSVDKTIYFALENKLYSCFYKDSLNYEITLITELESNIVINRILKSKEGNWLFGTTHGLIVYNPNSGLSENYINIKSDKYSLIHNNVTSLFQSNDGTIWVGTRNGLSKVENVANTFNLYRSTNGINGLASPHVSSFWEESDSTFLIGTAHGLHKLNINSGKIELLKMKNSQMANAPEYIISINNWNEKILLGMKDRGILILHSDDSTYKVSQWDIPELNNVTINTFKTDKQNNLWIGTSGKALFRISEKEEVRQFKSTENEKGLRHTHVYSLECDKLNRVWVGTASGGLSCYDQKTNLFYHFKGKELTGKNFILNFKTDHLGYLWVGTTEGMLKSQKAIINYSSEELNEVSKSGKSIFTEISQISLPNDVIYSIQQDGRKNIWVSTNRGISKISYNQLKAISNYGISDGLQSYEFNQNAYLTSSNGCFFYGGIDGFNYFYPDSINDIINVNKPFLTSLYIFGEEVVSGKKHSSGFMGEKSVSYAERINLSYKHKRFSIQFCSPNYSNQNSIIYNYKLEKFDESWVRPQESNIATYTNLNPGTYTFLVKAISLTNNIESSPTRIRVHISTPPWKSWYAIALYLLTFVVIIYTTLKVRITRLKNKLKLERKIQEIKLNERERFRKQSSADFHDEAGKYITKINLVTELAKRKSQSQEINLTLEKVQGLSKSLSRSMRDFLWNLNPQMDNLQELVYKIVESANFILEDTSIEFIIKPDISQLKQINLSMDVKRNILLIFQELAINTSKYSNATKAEFDVTLMNQEIKFTLTDNGIGYDAKVNKKNHYGLTIIKERAEKIGVDLIVNTAINEGTSNTLILKMPQMGD